MIYPHHAEKMVAIIHRIWQRPALRSLLDTLLIDERTVTSEEHDSGSEESMEEIRTERSNLTDPRAKRPGQTQNQVQYDSKKKNIFKVLKQERAKVQPGTDEVMRVGRQ
jgi:hypothetical protein